jgi:hypothetical protein
MVKKLLMSMLLLGLTSIILTGNSPLNCLAANERATVQSPFAGRYSGEWIAKVAGSEDHTGTWVLTINTDGEVIGREHDKTIGQKADFKGFIEEDGYMELFLKYTEATYTIKGTLTKRGERLTGALRQYSGSRTVATMDVILKRE